MNIYLSQVCLLALDNEHTALYYKLVTECLNRTIPSEYIERHHILPKSFKLGGEIDKTNLVHFTFEEHFRAHEALSKMFSDIRLRKKMEHALGYMQKDKHGNRILTAEQYSIACEAKRNAQSGHEHSEETKRKIGSKHLGMKRSDETCRNIGDAKIGMKHTDATKFIISRTHKGKPKSEEHKAKMRKPKSPEHKAKLVANLKYLNSKRVNLIDSQSILQR